MSQFRPVLLLVLLLHVSSIAVHVKGEPSDSKSKAVQDAKDKVSAAEKTLAAAKIEMTAKDAAAKEARKALMDAQAVRDRAAVPQDTANRKSELANKAKEALTVKVNAQTKAFQDAGQAAQDAEIAIRAVRAAQNNLNEAKKEAAADGASEETKANVKAKEADLAAANAHYTAKGNYAKALLDKINRENSEMGKAIAAAEEAADTAKKEADAAQKAADAVKGTLGAAEGTLAAAKADMTEKDAAAEKAKKAVMDAEEALAALVGAPNKGDKTTGGKVPPKSGVIVPPMPDVNKTTTLSATAISSTIPAVLITSVVFLYLYNW